MVTAKAELARPVHQARSARTRQAILRSGRKLLEARTFDNVSVEEIARRARCSVGGFYARFATKDAMLLAIEEQLLVELADDLEVRLERAVAQGLGIPGLVSVYIRTMVARFREHRQVLQAVVRRNQDSGRVLAHIERFNERVHEALLHRILARRDEIHHPDPESAAVLGLFFASASARAAVIGDKLEVHRRRIDDDQLATELIRAYLAFLGLPLHRREK